MAEQRVIRHYAGLDYGVQSIDNTIGRGLTHPITYPKTNLASIEIDFLISSKNDCVDLIKFAESLIDNVFND